MDLTKPVCDKTIIEQAGHDTWRYRIPGLVVTAAGTVLAYYEIRRDADDWNACGIGLRRSTDGGLSWSPRLDLVTPDSALTINNPVMVAARSGLVHFLWETGYNRMYHQVSRDDGLTWSEPVERTSVLNVMRTRYAWTAFGLGPGHGIETRDGRLLVPVWLCDGGGRAHRPSVVATLYSEDDGRSWSCGAIVPRTTDCGEVLVNPNESALVELRDGRILINMRHETNVRHRALAVSDQGIGGWSAPWLDERLPDPVCCAGMACWPGMPGDPDVLAFSNCATGGPQRTDLTIRTSPDEGLTWPAARMLEKEAGYSDLASHGPWLYCFYEQGRADPTGICPQALVMARINRAWLDKKPERGE